MEELFEAIKSGQREVVRGLVLAAPERFRALHAGATPVLFATYLGQEGVLQELLALSPALSAHEAAAVGSLPQLQAALKASPGALDTYSEDGWTVLHLGAFFGQRACVEYLLEKGADVKATSHNGLRNRPLHAAAARNHTDVCRVLVANGAEADATQHGGYTALHSAAQHGNEALVEALLAAGATAGLLDDQGKAAWQYAEEKGHAALAARLRAASGS